MKWQSWIDTQTGYKHACITEIVSCLYSLYPVLPSKHYLLIKLELSAGRNMMSGIIRKQYGRVDSGFTSVTVLLCDMMLTSYLSSPYFVMCGSLFLEPISGTWNCVYWAALWPLKIALSAVENRIEPLFLSLPHAACFCAPGWSS